MKICCRKCLQTYSYQYKSYVYFIYNSKLSRLSLFYLAQRIVKLIQPFSHELKTAFCQCLWNTPYLSGFIKD